MRRILYALALTAAGGCKCDDSPKPVDAGAPPPRAVVVTETEPNDELARGLVLRSDTSVDGNLGADVAKPDVDVFILEADDAVVELSVTSPRGGDVAIEFLDEGGHVIDATNAEGLDATERYPNVRVVGRRAFRVTGAKKGAGGAYALNAKFLDAPVGFESEPNPRPVDATRVGWGTAVSGYVASPTDVDVYRFEVPPVNAGESTEEAASPTDASTATVDAGATEARRLPLRLELTGIPGAVLAAKVLSEAEAVLFEAQSDEGQPLSLRNIAIRDVDRVFFVVVYSVPAKKGDRAAFSGSVYYTLTVGPEEEGVAAELEPNDDSERATPLTGASYREGFISPRGDTDFFRIDVAEPSVAQFTLTGLDAVDLELSLVRRDGGTEETVLRSNNGALKEPERLQNVLCVDTCFLRVAAASRQVAGKWVRSDFNSEQTYRLSAELSPAADAALEQEPNNTSGQASPLSVGQPLRGTVFPKKDVDWFRIDLTQKPVKTALRISATGVLKVDVVLSLHRLDEDGSLHLVQTSPNARGDATEVIRYSAEPAVYLLELKDAKSREANFQDAYQVMVEEVSEPPQ